MSIVNWHSVWGWDIISNWLSCGCYNSFENFLKMQSHCTEIFLVFYVWREGKELILCSKQSTTFFYSVWLAQYNIWLKVSWTLATLVKWKHNYLLNFSDFVLLHVFFLHNFNTFTCSLFEVFYTLCYDIGIWPSVQAYSSFLTSNW